MADLRYEKGGACVTQGGALEALPRGWGCGHAPPQKFLKNGRSEMRFCAFLDIGHFTDGRIWYSFLLD